jgi:S-adenosylmethionine hydrolase
MTDFRANGILTLTTDFGTQDGYVGAMKGVILSIDRQTRLVDIGHNIPPQNITHAASVVADSTPCFPNGTVHLVVVDPGVGSHRAPVVAQIDGHLYVGADNGLFPAVAERLGRRLRARRIEPVGPLLDWLPEHISHTFHGRDVFAPVAGGLASGQFHFDTLHPKIELMTNSTAPPVLEDKRIIGRIVTFDHFGNAMTNIRAEHLDTSNRFEVRVNESQCIPVVDTYASVPQGQAAAVIGSAGYLEIAIREGSARTALRLKPDMPITVVLPDGSR